MARPLLVLDIDGVISPWFRPAAGWGGWPTWHANPELTDWSWFWWSPEQVAAIGALNVDIVWLTAWRDNANVALPDLFGWTGPYPVVPWTDGPYGSHSGKADGLSAFLESDTFQQGGWDRIVWVDDELAPGGDLDPARVSHPLGRFDHLLVGPHRNEGLTVGHVDQLSRWVG